METLSDRSLDQYRFAIPKHILVATDLNDGDFLIPHAVAQAKTSGATITLVHAILPADVFPVGSGTVPYVVPSYLDRDIDLMMAEMANKITAQGVPCNYVAKHGFPNEIVPEQIESTGATRLIIASHGRGKVGQFLLGSVANQLLGTVTIPIFAVGPHCSVGVQNAMPKNMLHPVSMQGHYRESATLAVELARQFNAELTLLHIPDRNEEESIHPGHTIAWAENLFAKLLPGGLPSDPRIHISIGFGNVVEHIQYEAERTNADWIVLGIEEEAHMWPLQESTAYRVMAQAKCPVLAIPRPRQEVRSVAAAELAARGQIFVGIG